MRTAALSLASRRGGRLLTQPERTIYSVKRLMGRGPADVQGELKLFPFRIDPASKSADPRDAWQQGLYAAGDFLIHSARAEELGRSVASGNRWTVR